MKLFTYDLERYKTAFCRDSYVLAKQIVSTEFLAFAVDQLNECRSSGFNELPAREIKSKKKQYLFDPPPGGSILNELVRSVSGLAGLLPDGMNVSERHLMVYDSHAAALPPLHKDRLASRFSIGIPLEASHDARIALLVDGPQDKNLLDNAVYRQTPPVSPVDCGLSSSFSDTTAVSKPALIELDAQPGDAVIFAGSSIFHGRLNAAGSSILYFKLSDLHLDPLCEDPATLQQRAVSLDLLQHMATTGDLLQDFSVDLSPRLQNICRIYSRSNWATVLRVTVSGGGDFTISDQELGLLFRIEGRSKVRTIIDASPGFDFASALHSVRRLVEMGAIDLVAEA